MTRTFIALELRESLQQYLGEIIDRLARELPSLRWVDPAGIHLTLAFLGELNGAQLSEATATAEIAAQQVSLFSYHLSHLGTFGSARQPSVVWVGIDEGLPGHAPWSPLRNLHRILNEELAKRGFEVDRRPFSPHFTLSRVKQPLPPDDLLRLQRLLKEVRVDTAAHTVEHMSVMKSELSRSGAIYTCLAKFALGK